MHNTFETFAYAAGENLTAPDCAVIAVAGAVEADADCALVPVATLGEYGSDVSAMMLHGEPFRCQQFRGMDRRNVLGMRVVNQHPFVGINFLHRNQILDGFAASAKRFVIVQVSNVLADEGLSIHNKRNRVLEVGALS